jgi:hypothetical protein
MCRIYYRFLEVSYRLGLSHNTAHAADLNALNIMVMSFWFRFLFELIYFLIFQ